MIELYHILFTLCTQVSLNKMQSVFGGRGGGGGGIFAQAEVVYMIYLSVYLYRWRKDWEQQQFSDGGQNKKSFCDFECNCITGN